MGNLHFKISKILAKQILFLFVDMSRNILPYFDKYRTYRIAFKEYDKFRDENKINFQKEISRLRQENFIQKYYKDKTCYLELTNKGKEKLKKDLSDCLEIQNNNSVWDGKWRMVIFDIPNEKSKTRDYLRRKLINLGFIELQKSIYIFPFECLNEINYFKTVYYLKPYIQYVVADRVETETNLIKRFLETGILRNDMLITKESNNINHLR